METTFSTDLRCQKCVAKITPILDQEPAVKHWSTDLQHPHKTLTVEVADADDLHRIAELMGGAGYHIAPLSPSAAGIDSFTAEASQSWFQTYQPLLLVVSYVIGLTVFAESMLGGPVWSRAMMYFMGFFFLGFAFFKLLNVSGFADAFSTYDILAKRSRWYALAYPWIELTLGLIYLSGQIPVVAAMATIAIMGVGLIGVVAAVRRQQTIQCACLGTVFNLPMSVVTIIENSVMIAMAAGMLVMRGSAT